jgi:hypothetical protein
MSLTTTEIFCLWNRRRAVFVASLCVLSLLGCSRSEREWKQAQQSNTVAAFDKYVSDFPQSKYLAEARSRIESLEWDAAQLSNTVAAFDKYIGRYPDGKHFLDAKNSMEALEWNAALSAHNESKLNALIAKYPASANVAKAKEEIWTIRWPPVNVEKADSVSVYTGGIGVVMGRMETPVSSLLGFGGSGAQAAGPNRIVIWRNFAPKQLNTVNKLGLRTGIAFLKSDEGKYRFVRKVDLSRTDDELARDFGVVVRK